MIVVIALLTGVISVITCINWNSIYKLNSKIKILENDIIDIKNTKFKNFKNAEGLFARSKNE